MSSTDVVVVGAGPHGLSVAAHLSARGVERRVFGVPMGTWRDQMPAGMMLRSEPYGSDFAAPSRGFSVRDYCETHGLDYVDRLGPLSAERFLDYSQWYIDRLVPDIENTAITSLSTTERGFQLVTADGERIDARQVVVATGVAPFVNMPSELAGLPSSLASHTMDHHDLTAFRGRSVAMIGGGQSALETGALLHEAGAQVHLVARREKIEWLVANPEHISTLGHIKRPVNKLCEGWHCAVWNSPAAFRRLPVDLRVRKALSVLGPAGAWWLKDRVEGQFEVLASHTVKTVQPHESGVRLSLTGPTRASLDVDHVMAGTGFRIDINRLSFLEPGLQASIDKLANSPVLDRSCESSVPGLFFVGAPAAVSNGPSMRFVAGTHNSAAWVARRVARSAGPRQPSRALVRASEPSAGGI